jgi:hypothetical protein
MPAGEATIQGLYEMYLKNSNMVLNAFKTFMNSSNIVIGEKKESKITARELFCTGHDPTMGNPLITGTLIMLAAKARFYTINVGEAPKEDRKLDINNETLKQLSFGKDNDIKIVVWGKHGDCDGVVKIKETSIPLEVGNCQPETVLWHLYNSKSIARWPYYSKHIYIISLNDSIKRRDK